MQSQTGEPVPKILMSNFKKYKATMKRSSESEHGWKQVYAQDRGFTRMLKPGTKFLYCE